MSEHRCRPPAFFRVTRSPWMCRCGREWQLRRDPSELMGRGYALVWMPCHPEGSGLMARIGLTSFVTETDCPRCGLPIYIDVLIGPGMSVGTAEDGTAEASIQVRGESRPHVCKGYEVALACHDETHDT